MEAFIKYFNEIDIEDIPEVGGKNASLGEMYQKLTSKGIQVPDGFAVTSAAYWQFLKEAELKDKISSELEKLDREEYSNLREVGNAVRDLISTAE
ncbi:MAG: PEP/pyruvate-binding domain-containing protein, partial [Cyclobacteriaceae bacterium]